MIYLEPYASSYNEYLLAKMVQQHIFYTVVYAVLYIFYYFPDYMNISHSMKLIFLYLQFLLW